MPAAPMPTAMEHALYGAPPKNYYSDEQRSPENPDRTLAIATIRDLAGASYPPEIRMQAALALLAEAK